MKQNAENVDCKIREKERKTWNPPKSKPPKKLNVYLKKLERTRRIQCEGLEKFVYDPKSVGKFVGIVKQIENIIFYKIINNNHVHMR